MSLQAAARTYHRASSIRSLSTLSLVSRRNFSALASASVTQPAFKSTDNLSIKGGWSNEKFNTVPFVKEPLRAVLEEVPDVKYYYIGDNDPKPYPYKDIPIDQQISLEVGDSKRAGVLI